MKSSNLSVKGASEKAAASKSLQRLFIEKTSLDGLSHGSKVTRRPAGKLAAIRRYGAEVCLLQHDTWWRIIQHRGHPSEPGVYVDAVRDNRALAGNATIGLEIVEQLPDVATILVPFGGGGVACGILPPRCVRSNRRSASSPRNALRQHR